MSAEQRQERRGIRRFREVLLEAMTSAAFSILGRTVTGDGDEMSGSRRRVSPEFVRDMVTVEIGKADVAEDVVGPPLVGDADAFGSRVSDLRFVTGKLQDSLQRLGSVEIVLDDQDSPTFSHDPLACRIRNDRRRLAPEREGNEECAGSGIDHATVRLTSASIDETSGVAVDRSDRAVGRVVDDALDDVSRLGRSPDNQIGVGRLDEVGELLVSVAVVCYDLPNPADKDDFFARKEAAVQDPPPGPGWPRIGCVPDKKRGTTAPSSFTEKKKPSTRPEHVEGVSDRISGF
jgi:hypothetical protein